MLSNILKQLLCFASLIFITALPVSAENIVSAKRAIVMQKMNLALDNLILESDQKKFSRHSLAVKSINNLNQELHELLRESEEQISERLGDLNVIKEKFESLSSLNSKIAELKKELSKSEFDERCSFEKGRALEGCKFQDTRFSSSANFEFLESCSAVEVYQADSGQIRLGGIVSNLHDHAQLLELFGARAGANVEVQMAPVCTAQLQMKALLAPSSQSPRIEMRGGKDSFRLEENLSFTISVPDYANFLYVAYLDASDNISFLRNRSSGRWVRRVSPNSVHTFGDGKNGRYLYSASKPTGAEAVIAVVADSPITALDAFSSNADFWQMESSVFYSLINRINDDQDAALKSASIRYLTINE